MQGQTSQAGFTLTELVVTMAIIGVVGAVALNTSKSTVTAREPAAITTEVGDTLAGASQAIIRSPATSADAIAAGYPPDVRGRITVSMKFCPGAYGGTPSPVPTDLGFDCKTSMYQYLQVNVERLLAGGGFELIDKSYVPFNAMQIINWGTGEMIEHGGILTIIATPGTYVSSGVPQCQVDAWGQMDYACFLDVLVNQRSGVTVSGDMYGGNNKTPHEVRCYHNSTCDPVTYWFAFQDGAGKQSQARIAVTPFGSITNIPTWQ